MEFQSDHDITFNALPFRSYCKIWNDWYRDQNLQSAVDIHKDSVEREVPETIEPVVTTEFGINILKANKFHDMFTSCLPAPQKGDPVNISFVTDAPVVTSRSSHLMQNDL